MDLSSHVNNRSELNESMRKGTIDALDTMCSIMKDELIVSDDNNFIDVCTREEDSFYSQNNVEKIEDISINSGEANEESFVEICDSNTKIIISTNSTIHQVNNDKKVSEFSQCAGITTNKLMNHSANERSAKNFSKIDRNKNIELYCAKCDSISRPTTYRQRETCALCNNYIIYQCKVCKKQYIRRDSMYRHLKNECINIEPQYNCSQCEYKGKYKRNLQRHVKAKHSVKKCAGCGEIFNDIYALKKHHLHKCLSKPMFKCNCCPYKTIFKTRLEKHIRLELNSKYVCSRCGKKYINLKAFKNHKKNDCGSKLHFECNHCSYSTNRKGSMGSHIRSKHSEIFVVGDSL